MERDMDYRLPTSANEIILESISDGVFTVDHTWRITYFNRAAEEITGVSRHEAVGRLCSEVFRASMCESACALRSTMATGQPIVNRSAYIVDADGARIPVSVSTALLRDAKGEVVGGVETFRDLSLVDQLRKELEGRFEAGDMISRSPSMRKIFDILPQIAASDATVVIEGETGTGKELLARAIHSLSKRSAKPFVAVNCGALPDTLLESELFGYKAGAFTGAERDKPGRFAAADTGTIFLDEIGDVSPALQIRLLRVLQERVYEPLGSNVPVKVDVKVIVATNKDLSALVENGTFRQDLFYRLNVVSLRLPALRERKEDISLLTGHFIERLNVIEDASVEGVTPEAMAVLLAHDYPGNVRELENIIQRAFVLCRSGFIDTVHLPDELISRVPLAARGKDMGAAVKAAEARVLLDALERNKGNRLAAARELGIHKSTLFRKIRSLGVDTPRKDGRSGPKRNK